MGRARLNILLSAVGGSFEVNFCVTPLPLTSSFVNASAAPGSSKRASCAWVEGLSVMCYVFM
jgi:hypothetical protein